MKQPFNHRPACAYCEHVGYRVRQSAQTGNWQCINSHACARRCASNPLEVMEVGYITREQAMEMYLYGL